MGNATKQTVEEVITSKFLDALAAGTCPWRKPWNAGQMPQNWTTRRPYSGLNFFLLSMAPFACPFYDTFNGIKKAGGKVKKGEKSQIVTFWKWIEKGEKGNADYKRIPFLRYFHVFNLEQTEGIDWQTALDEQTIQFEPIAEAEKLATNYSERESLEVRHREQRAYYVPSLDFCNMPRKETFRSVEEYYSTLFHELGHSTGHKNRLDRKLDGSFGSEPYGKEELIAELTSAFLCAELGIDNSTFDNSAAYLNSWLRKLRSEPKLIVQAASKAKHAASFIREGKEVTA